MRYQNNKFRHENKYSIGIPNYISLKQKLKSICLVDPNADEDGSYLITSLYFDNCYDKALNEKRHGVPKREKFRIRYYGNNTEHLFLEKKQKVNGLCLKTSAPLNKEQVQRLIDYDWHWLLEEEDPLLKELGFKMQTQLLRPKTVVRYKREPYIFGPGNVRITFDMAIESGLTPDWFFDTEALYIDVNEKPSRMILEVKYDEYLPDVIRTLIQPDLTRVQAFSKYQQARTYF